MSRMRALGGFCRTDPPSRQATPLSVLGSLPANVVSTISSKVSSPSYNEASLILECRKIFRQDILPDGFIDKTIENHYPAKDYHRVYFGEILTAFVEE